MTSIPYDSHASGAASTATVLPVPGFRGGKVNERGSESVVMKR